jgi:hypothetical protein
VESQQLRKLILSRFAGLAVWVKIKMESDKELTELTENCPVCGKSMTLKDKHIERKKSFFRRKHSTFLTLEFECSRCRVVD